MKSLKIPGTQPKYEISKSMKFDLIRKIIKQITELNLNIAIIKMNLELFWLEIMIFFYHVYGNLFQSGLILKVH